MQSFAHYAVPATIVLSALGAIVLCVVLLLYGFKAEATEEEQPSHRQLFAIRLGHALAAACFAGVVMLATVAFIHERGVTAQAPATSAAGIATEVRTLRERLEATETRLADAQRQLATLQSRVPPNTASTPAPAVGAERPATAPALALPERPARPSKPRAAPARSISSPPVPRPPAATPRDDPGMALPAPPRASNRQSPDASTHGGATPVPAREPSYSVSLGEKVRRDWETVKQGFRDAGDDIRNGFDALGRGIRERLDSMSR